MELIRKRQVAIGPALWLRTETELRMARQYISPRSSRTAKLEAGQRPPQVLAEHPEHLPAVALAAQPRAQQAKDLGAILLQQTSGRRPVISGAAKPVNLFF